MKKYKNFDEMFNDNDYVSEEDREIINLEVKLIGKMIEAREKQGLTQRDLAKIRGKTACHCKNRISALYTTIGHSFKSVDSSWLFFGNYSFAKGKLAQPHRTILKEFLLENKKEVIDMVFFEYDAEAEKRVIYRDGVEEGRAISIVQLCKTFGMSKEDIIQKLENDLSIPPKAAIDYYEKYSKELEISC